MPGLYNIQYTVTNVASTRNFIEGGIMEKTSKNGDDDDVH
jgi:hypothetical protein